MSSEPQQNRSSFLKDFLPLIVGLILGMLTVGVGYLVIVKFIAPGEPLGEELEVARNSSVSNDRPVTELQPPAEKLADSPPEDNSSPLPEMSTLVAQEAEAPTEGKVLGEPSTLTDNSVPDSSATIETSDTVVEETEKKSEPETPEEPLVASVDPDAVENPKSVAKSEPVAQFPQEASSDSPEESKTKENAPAKEAEKEAKEEDKPRQEIRLTKRRWTNLVLFNGNPQGESAIPDDFPVQNFPKGYSFVGDKFDSHRLSKFTVDGEFIIRNGYLVREFGKESLLRLPSAENFDLDGIIAIQNKGGWMVLVGWDVESKTGYAIYNTQLVNSGHWFLVEIKDGKAVEFSVKKLIEHETKGEGPLRLRVDNKKVSMQAAGAYLFRDVPLPNYQKGHVAIGTFSPFYGPRPVGIKSLRMMLR